MTDEAPELEKISVPCHNCKDGCRNLVEYFGEPGSKAVKKVCQRCQEYGAPSERIGKFGKVPRGMGNIPKHFMEFGAEAMYEVTVWPKASFFSGGRVSGSPIG